MSRRAMGLLAWSLVWALSACGPGVNTELGGKDAGTDAGPTPTGNPIPVLEAVTSDVVDVEGTAVRLRVTGSGFLSTSTVRVKEQPLSTTFVSEHELVAVLSEPGAVRWKEDTVTVFNPDPGGGPSMSLPIPAPVPVLLTATPDTITFEDETPVRLTVTGRNFVVGGQLVFRSVAYPTTVRSAELAEVELSPVDTVLSPIEQAQGILDTLVMTSPVSNPFTSLGFTLNLRRPVPEILSASPVVLSASDDTYYADGGVQPPVLPNLMVNLRNVRTGSVLKWNDQAIEVIDAPFVDGLLLSVPKALRATPGVVRLTLETPAPGGGVSAPFFVSVLPGPSLESVRPQQLFAGSGAQSLFLMGKGFGMKSVVYWDGQALETEQGSIDALRGIAVTATVPASALAEPGLHTLTVHRDDGLVSNALRIEVVGEAPAPRVRYANPAVWQRGTRPSTLSVIGDDFTRASILRVDGQDRPTLFKSESELSIELTAEDVAEVGVHALTVHTPGPGGGTSLPLLLNVEARQPVPRLTALSPASAPAGSPGLNLTLSGVGVAPSAAVRWNSETLVSHIEDGLDGPELAAFVPKELLVQPGLARVTVVNPPPGGGPSAPLFFTILDPSASAIGIFPMSLEAVQPGATFFVSGNGFTADSRAMVDGEPRVPEAFSSTTLTVPLTQADLAQVRNLEVRVVTPGQGTSNPAILAVTGPRPPWLTTLSLGVLSVGALPEGEKVALGAWGNAFLWKDFLAPGEGGEFRVTLDWDGVAHPVTGCSTSWGNFCTTSVTAETLTTPRVVPVTVSRAAEGGVASLPALLNVVAERPAPALDSVLPASVHAGVPSIWLKLMGRGLHPASVARWNGQALPTAASKDLKFLDVKVPGTLLATPGVARVTVMTPAPGGGESPPIAFEVWAE